ncbi:MAG TPA: bifunctional DNA-formamidopyrimidine glycosylase/DNA-(apurinic or apyrimidinic site) lyase [Vicinamibacteria bacterium]|nr:bifunctional DNA-formamidopyrimidine glycosylase/DNA-(apurinic or apyrimidinic site) lyase [Vicinamibacteria bacterium]
MPELPEVEIARESLEAWLLGRKIDAVRAPDSRIRGGVPRRKFETALRGSETQSVERRGKFLVLGFGENRPGVLAHLGMTGQFVYLPTDDPLPRFTRVELRLSDGGRVVLKDPRRLGQFRLLDEREQRRVDSLGIEPLSSAFTHTYLHTLLRRSHRAIKLFLMDQKKIAGIGNIQAAEALFLAGVHPSRAARSLSRDEARLLTRSVKTTLRTEIRRYRSRPLYLFEGAPNSFLVYGRAGEPCSRCDRRIRRVVQGGRTSYYCATCQPSQPSQSSQRRKKK